MKKILITGKYGQVGWELQRTMALQGNVTAIDMDTLDFSDSDAIVKVIRNLRPDILINAAAYTAVDKAENEPEIAMAVNGIAPAIMAEEIKRLKGVFVHYSTDYVFNGESSHPFCEEHLPAPLNIYGKSKLAGDQAIQAIGGSYIILRTSWVYGTRGKNFLLTMLKLAKERSQLKIVNDQIGAPTWSRFIAQATANILNHPQDNWGLYNLTASGQTSWQHFAEAIFKIASRFPDFKHPEVLGISSYEYPTPAQRPRYSMLSNEKLLKTFSLKMPAWDEALELCMQELYASRQS